MSHIQNGRVMGMEGIVDGQWPANIGDEQQKPATEM